MKKHLLLAGLLAAGSSAFALSITVAPSTGVASTAVTNTIADALAQINAGADANNTITLRSTEGAHVQPDNTTWTINAGKNVDFVAESGRPVIVTSWAAGQYMLIITSGAGCAVSFTGLGWVPEIDLGYGNNVADGISLAGTGASYTLTDCIFAANDGSNGLSSLDGSAAFLQPTSASPSVGGRNVGDDWLQHNSSSANLTISNCVFTGCNDDAIVTLGGAHTVTINQGTVVANVGGAGYQNAGDNETIVIDGSAGRILFAKCGLRTGVGSAADTGPKFFGDVGVSVTMTHTDIVEVTNGGFYDFGGIPTINISDCRIALNNSSGTATGANLSFDDLATDSVATNQVINLTRVTVHDSSAATNTDGIYSNEGATDPRQIFTIVDSIFSGAGDTYANMTNGANPNGASPAPAVSFSAVVTNGPHALGTTGELGTPALNGDPAYASLTYTIGRSQTNPDFLRPQNPAFATASSTSGNIGGIPLLPNATVADWTVLD